MAFVAVVDCSC